MPCGHTTRVAVAGSLRRACEVVRDIDLVVGCRADPATVATALTHLPGVAQVVGGGGPSPTLLLATGVRADLYCVPDDRFEVALWRATGSQAHTEAAASLAAARGFRLSGDTLLDSVGQPVPVTTETGLYEAVGLTMIAPELRENRGEIEAARTGGLPNLVQLGDIQGVLHCHSNYSDGTASILDMARAAQARGWSYLGLSDHSQSAAYAGGLDRDAILRQHDEIDQVNQQLPAFRVLKGIEADILADGTVDYGAELLDRFDYVIGSVHSRFGMAEGAMTNRILRAHEDPHLTILGHPTGRLLLTREPYAVNLGAIIDRAVELGVALELNCDPHRLDLDWRWLQVARARGATIELGPDAHSPDSLGYIELGVAVARKGWLEAGDVLNARRVDAVLEFARARRARASRGTAAGR